MGAFKDMGLDYQPLERTFLPAPPEQDLSGHVVDELIDEEIKEWGHVEETKLHCRDAAAIVDRMAGSALPDPQMREKVTRRLADFMVSHGVDATNETAVKRMVVKLAQRAEPLGLGGEPPVVRAYAAAQMIRRLEGERR